MTLITLAVYTIPNNYYIYTLDIDIIILQYLLNHCTLLFTTHLYIIFDCLSTG